MDQLSQERDRELRGLKLRAGAIIALTILASGLVAPNVLVIVATLSLFTGVFAYFSCINPARYGSFGRKFTGWLRFADLAIVLSPAALGASQGSRLFLAAGILFFADAATRRSQPRLLSLVSLGLSMCLVAYLIHRINADALGLVASVILVSAICSAFLMRMAWREDTLGQHVSRLEAMLSCSNSMVTEPNIRSILAEILKASVLEVGASEGYVMLVDEDSASDLVTEVAFSKTNEFGFPKKLVVGQGLSGQVVQKSQPVALHGTSDALLEIDGQGLDSRTVISVPISSRGVFTAGLGGSDETLGVMTVIGSGVSSGDMPFLCSVASLMSVSIANSRIEGHQRATFFKTLEGIATALEARDAYTAGHSARVCALSLLLAASLGFDQGALNELRLGAILHDIGKIGVPDEIMNKKGKLTEEELATMKSYPIIGYEICRPLRLNEGVLMIIRNHQEKLDGTGYPDGLRGGELPPLLRIVCVADAFDAMSSFRPYRAVLNTDEVFVELNKYAGTHYDPVVVEALRSLLGTQKFDAIYEELWQRGVQRAA